MSIPVICDRCRSTGFAGETDFSHLGDLLDFTPVPRKKERVDGWTPERQRAFIAALSATGSKRRAAMSIGMHAYGVDQLLKAEGSDSFKAACERAMAIAAQHGSMKIAQGVADAAARNAVLGTARGQQSRNAELTPPSRLRGLPSPLAGEGEGDIGEEQKLQLVEHLAGKFLKKVAAERQARLNGEIVAADFYLRQITVLEVMFDLTAGHFGWNAGEVLRDLRRGRAKLLEIVSTPFADWLDGPWGSRGEEGYSTYVDQNATGALTTPARGYSADEWAKMTGDEQRVARQVQFDVDAEEQREWERRAHEEWQARQSSSSLSRGNGEGDHLEGGGGVA